MTGPLDPQQAQELLNRAHRQDATARAGASWPHIAGLLGMGAASSLALVALAYVPPSLIWLPMALLFVWLGALLAFGGVFGHGRGAPWPGARSRGGRPAGTPGALALPGPGANA